MAKEIKTRAAAAHTILIDEWVNAKAALDAAKSREMFLRTQLVDLLFSTAPIGTSHYVDSQGDLAVVKKYNYKLGDNEQVAEMLGKVAALIGNELTSRLIKWKPDISVSEYKLLPSVEHGPEAVKLIDKVLTITPATPELKFTAAKGK